MTNEQIKDIKLALECCADEVDGCPKCPYARKNAKDGIAHCREMYLDALQLIDEYEKGKEQTVAAFAEYLDDEIIEHSHEFNESSYDAARRILKESLKEFLPNADLPQ